jgi:hypothetical protein
MEILASLDDVNANLDGDVIVATDENTELIQVSVARVVRAYLSLAVDNLTLYSWKTPETTPEVIREIAAKLIASQVYFVYAARSSLDIDIRSFAQLKYDEAVRMLEAIVAGTIVIPGTGEIATGTGMSELDFFPVDDTDQAFTMGREF